MSGAKRSTRKGRWKWRTSRLQTYLPSLLLWSRLSRFRTEKTQFPFWVNKGFANALWKFAISRRVIALMFLSFFACLLAHFFLASFLTPSILLIFHAPFLATKSSLQRSYCLSWIICCNKGLPFMASHFLTPSQQKATKAWFFTSVATTFPKHFVRF